MEKARFGSLQPNVDDILDWNNYNPGDFDVANADEKASFIADRESVGYWADAWRRLRKNKVAMVAAGILVLIFLFAFLGPVLVPYGYEQFIKGAENMHPWHYSYEDQVKAREMVAAGNMDPEEAVAKAQEEAAAQGKTLSPKDLAVIRAKAKAGSHGEGKLTIEQALAEIGAKAKPFGYSFEELERKANGESVFPHVFGTDGFGRDIMVRVMMGTRVSILVGVLAALLVLVIGALYGSISGYCGGRVDAVMQRVVDVIYAMPEVLVILLISVVLNETLLAYADSHQGTVLAVAISSLGTKLIAMFIAFGLLYWVTMSRIIRGQIIQLKEQEYVTAAKALGAKGGRIIRHHLLPNCIGQIVTTTFLQIPSAIFLESFLSYLGVGVSAPMTSLGSMASDALKGIISYPYRLIFPAVVLSLMILCFNLFGDGLRDALDPRLKK